MRMHQRPNDRIRPLVIRPGFQKGPAGSVLIEQGDTRVCVSATVDNRVPPWFPRDRRGGWITAEYAMLPGATLSRHSRNRRGREEEIQRLIGRSLRAAVNLEALGPHTITVDCDVLQADAGTRCASITGGFVALVLAMDCLLEKGQISSIPLQHAVCALSCSLSDGTCLLDPDYPEDCTADADLNFVFTQDLSLVEIQGTAEGHSFSPEQLSMAIGMAQSGAREILEVQMQVLGRLFPPGMTKMS